MVPSTLNYEAVDTYYLTDSDLYVFQITCASSHDVKANGLFRLLERIKLTDDVFNDRIRMHLVFVVPKGQAFANKQEIVVEDYLTANQLTDFLVKDVKGVGSKKGKLLNDMGIMNVQELLEAVNEDIKANGSRFSFMKSAVVEFVSAVRSRDHITILKDILQRPSYDNLCPQCMRFASDSRPVALAGRLGDCTGVCSFFFLVFTKAFKGVQNEDRKFNFQNVNFHIILCDASGDFSECSTKQTEIGWTRLC
jgi:hypothetical protein